jgi:hypothetical protein
MAEKCDQKNDEITSRWLRRVVHGKNCRMYKNFVQWDKNAPKQYVTLRDWWYK